MPISAAQLSLLLGRGEIKCLGFRELKLFPWEVLAHLYTSAFYPSLNPSFDQVPGLGMRILRWASFTVLKDCTVSWGKQPETDNPHLRSYRRIASPSLVLGEEAGWILGAPDAVESLEETVGICQSWERGDGKEEGVMY